LEAQVLELQEEKKAKAQLDVEFL